MSNKLIIWFLVSFSLLAFISCNDDPTSLGEDFLPEHDLINVFKINSTDSAFQQKASVYDTDTLDLAGATRIFLGKHDNIESTMLMKFYMFLPDSIKDGILGDSLVLNSAVMEMAPIYTFGDENSYFDFTVHEITNDWNSLEFDRESLTELTYNTEDVSSNRQFIGDTLITFDINKELITNWLSLSANALQETNYGVYFNYVSGTDKILGFPAISSLDDSLLTRLKLIVEVPGNYVDTLTIQVTSDVHVVLGSLPTTSTQNIIIQGGIPIHSNLYFDVSKIPQYAIINKATIKLFIDENESTIGNISSDFLRVYLLNNFETSEINTDYVGVNLEIDSVEAFYSGEISHFVQEWLSNENNGMRISLYDEVDTMNKIAIFGTETPDSALRPYLEIIYTSKN